MDISFAEREKKLIRLGVWLLRKKLGEKATAEYIHEDMFNCGNDGIREITRIINDATDNISENFQKKTIQELSELGLWMCYKDTGYRDPFFWILDTMLSRADEIRELIKPYVKPPDK